MPVVSLRQYGRRLGRNRAAGAVRSRFAEAARHNAALPDWRFGDRCI